MIPCKKLKCLKFPVCKNKLTITCNLLSKHISMRMIELKKSDDNIDVRDIWLKAIGEINEVLPNVIPIISEK